jgi:hypothetical protein
MTIALYITASIAAINLGAILLGWRLARYRMTKTRPVQDAVVMSFPAPLAAGAK